MTKRIFIPTESYAFASPELRLAGKHTDVGLLAEALVLFENCDINVTNGINLADILSSFISSYGSIDPFFDLVESGSIRIHYFDFFTAPIEKDGEYSFWNIQDSLAAASHRESFEHKVLYHPAIDRLLRTRHRRKLYDVIPSVSTIDASEDYSKAIEAARAAAQSHEEIELLLNAFRDSLPADFRALLPQKIQVTTSHEPAAGKTKHTFNFNFEKLAHHFPNLNFGMHIPGVGLLQTYRVLYASRKHNYDIYLPHPLAISVLNKMDTLVDDGKKFTRTNIELTQKAGFPDIRKAFNSGALSWRDIIKIRSKGALFRQWFASHGGNPEVAIKSYGEEFKASTGLKSYPEKFFSIATYAGTAAGAAIGAELNGGAGAALGALIGGFAPFAKDLLTASAEDGWKPRFFGNWIHEIVTQTE